MNTNTSGATHRRNLTIVFGLTSAFMGVEVLAGFATGSLALLADAAHMLTDVAGVGAALLAMRFAERPATPERTYGFQRVEILAVMANCLVLLGVSGYVLFEAYRRWQSPPEVQSGAMLLVGAAGLVVNLISMRLLQQGAGESLNVKGAYFEVLSDMLTSIGVLVAAGVMLATDWYWADPVISAGIGLFILPRTWNLMKEATGILLEGVPVGLDLARVREAILAVAGVQGVHDLHVWSVTSGVHAMSGHAVIDPTRPQAEILRSITDVLRTNFEIQHTTIQLEPPGWELHETHL